MISFQKKKGYAFTFNELVVIVASAGTLRQSILIEVASLSWPEGEYTILSDTSWMEAEVEKS